jgi:hypothetical protein
VEVPCQEAVRPCQAVVLPYRAEDPYPEEAPCRAGSCHVVDSDPTCSKRSESFQKPLLQNVKQLRDVLTRLRDKRHVGRGKRGARGSNL